MAIYFLRDQPEISQGLHSMPPRLWQSGHKREWEVRPLARHGAHGRPAFSAAVGDIVGAPLPWRERPRPAHAGKEARLHCIALGMKFNLPAMD